MISSMNVAVDTDGVILVFWAEIIKRALKYFKKIDNTIMIDGYTIEDIFNLDQTRCPNYLVRYIEEYCKLHNDQMNAEEYEIRDIFGCSGFKRQMFWIKNIYDYCMNSPLMDDVVEKLKKWSEEGKKVFNITSREFVTNYGPLGSMFRKMLDRRYKEEGIEFDGIIYCSERKRPYDKMIACHALQIDVILEDFSNNVGLLSEIIQVLCYDAPHNRKCRGENIDRIKNLTEADLFIQKMDAIRREELAEINYIEDGDFKFLSSEEEQKLSKLELVEYYKQRKQYYINLASKDKDCRNINKLERDLTNVLFKLFGSSRIENKEMIPYPNQIGEIFVTNQMSLEEQMGILPSIRKRRVHLLIDSNNTEGRTNRHYKNVTFIHGDKDGQDITLDKLIKIVASGGTVLIPQENAVQIAQVTGAPIIPLVSDGSKVRVNNIIIVKQGEELEQANNKLTEMLTPPENKHTGSSKVKAARK